MLNEKIYDFLKQSGPIFFVTPAVGRAIGLESELPDFHIICSQKSESFELLRKKGAKVFCVQDREIKNSGKLLEQEEVVKYIKENSAGSRANIMTFKPSPMIEIVCEKNGFRYLGNDWRINRDWEDKVRFAQITNDLRVPNANSRIVKAEREKIDDLMVELGFFGDSRYVIQLSRGYSGNSTFMVKDPIELRRILNKNIGRKIKIADWKEGETYTFNVCVGNFGVFSSQPILQITGCSEFNRNNLGSCGNDYAYGKKLDGQAMRKINAYIGKVAEKISQAGYRGILGFDFLVGGNRADLIEVNPRMVGSIPVFTKLQIASGEMPFLLLHILSFLDFDFQGIRIENSAKIFDFSQIIMRNSMNFPMKISQAMRSGVYKTDERGEIFFRREGFFAENLSRNEFFLECAPAGQVIDSDMEYANIQLPCGIMETKDAFKNDFSRIKEKILSNIILK